MHIGKDNIAYIRSRWCPFRLLSPNFYILAWFTTYRVSADCECLHYANHFLSAQTIQDQSMSIPIPLANQCHSLSYRTGSNRKALFLRPCMLNQRAGVSEVLTSHPVPHKSHWCDTWWLRARVIKKERQKKEQSSLGTFVCGCFGQTTSQINKGQIVCVSTYTHLKPSGNCQGFWLSRDSDWKRPCVKLHWWGTFCLT